MFLLTAWLNNLTMRFLQRRSQSGLPVTVGPESPAGFAETVCWLLLGPELQGGAEPAGL